ncbi:hypothetical protein [Scleromatobacter humisilvae]|uniref:Ankyrin repeat domain-containing protein n=1 Tax=Scleromatobacter humisilvae TaxID=2897159 RepID=A0A9X1YEE3_9BURK|nr:hypothetical protein [Scleromatobacter humisilvae]MCK9684488.1 hypothetical protein [Scleromatobacter humisilvae]
MASSVSAANWQGYADRPNAKFEVDADSVEVRNGQVFFAYREQHFGPAYPKPIVSTMYAIADCAARKRADVSGSGKGYELRDVFDGTDQAAQLALVCRLAHLAGGEARDPALRVAQQRPAPSSAEDWRTYDRGATTVRQLDAGSVKAHDGLVWFNYRELQSYDAPEAFRRPLSGVVDCGARRGADVDRGRYTLRDVLEGTQQASQLDLACQLAKAAASPEAAAAAPAPQISRADAEMLWEEAVYTFDGLSYDYTTYRFISQDEATHCLANWQCPLDAHRLDQRTGERSNEIAPWLRDAVVTTLGDERSRPVHDPKTDAWVVVRVTARRPDKFDPKTLQPMAWLTAHAATALPSPDALRSDPALRKRSAMNRVFTAERLQSSLAAGEFGPGDLDRPLSGGMTLLTRALARHDEAFAAALVAAGASIDACGTSYCPIEFVISAQDHAGLRWVLAHGARVERSQARPGALPPLVLAAMAGDKESAQLLLDARADPLVGVDDSVFGQTLQRSLAYYVSGEQADFLDWIYAQMARADERGGHYAWKAWIEQGGRRQPIVDGVTITLQAQPFRIVMKVPDQTSFRIVSSEDAGFLAETRSAVTRRELLSPALVGAAGPDSRFLGVGSFVTRKGVREFDGSSLELSWQSDPKFGNGTKRVNDRRGEHEDVHEIAEFIAPSGTIAAKDYAHHTIHVLTGPMPWHGTASDLYKPARFDIVIR